MDALSRTPSGSTCKQCKHGSQDSDSCTIIFHVSTLRISLSKSEEDETDVFELNRLYGSNVSECAPIIAILNVEHTDPPEQKLGPKQQNR